MIIDKLPVTFTATPKDEILCAQFLAYFQTFLNLGCCICYNMCIRVGSRSVRIAIENNARLDF